MFPDGHDVAPDANGNGHDNLRIWNAVSHPPVTALRQISGGRLNGKTDINPQWRYQAMTQQFGPIGIGWTYQIVRLWLEPIADGQVCAFAEVHVRVRDKDTREWSEPIPGIGGSMLVAQEKSGLYASDEAYKMATTDALSVATKMLGVAAAIYQNLWDGNKFKDVPNGNGAPQFISPAQAKSLDDYIGKLGAKKEVYLRIFGVTDLSGIHDGEMFNTFKRMLDEKAKAAKA